MKNYQNKQNNDIFDVEEEDQYESDWNKYQIWIYLLTTEIYLFLTSYQLLPLLNLINFIPVDFNRIEAHLTKALENNL